MFVGDHWRLLSGQSWYQHHISSFKMAVPPTHLKMAVTPTTPNSSHLENLITITPNTTYEDNPANSTAFDSNYSYSEYEYNVAERAAYVFSQPYYILALLLGTLAILANVSSLLAIFYIRKSMTSHFRILISLIASDLLVDISLIGYVFNTVLNTSRCTYIAMKALNTTGLNITLLNLMAMAIDHYVGILHPFTFVTKRNTICMIVILWTVALLSGFSDFFSPVGDFHAFQNRSVHFCEWIWNSKYQEEFITFGIVIICFISMSVMYLRIYCEVKGMDRSSAITDSNVTKNNRALITTLLILGTFVLCWLPICIFNVVLI